MDYVAILIYRRPTSLGSENGLEKLDGCIKIICNQTTLARI